MNDSKSPEPWLRGTLTDVPAVLRAVLHALELAKDDLTQWCGTLSDDELNARYDGLPPVSFHLKHIARSVDRLLTYAEGGKLGAAQIAALRKESLDGATGEESFAELDGTFARAATRIRALATVHLDEGRAVGTRRLPATVAGLLVHIADHTQRHVGQAVTTAKIVRARRSG